MQEYIPYCNGISVSTYFSRNFSSQFISKCRRQLGQVVTVELSYSMSATVNVTAVSEVERGTVLSHLHALDILKNF